MSCNFYLQLDPKCPTCGHRPPPLHIGKSSWGWCFALHVIPGVAEGLADWICLFAKEGAVIIDEDGEALSPAKMLERIANRRFVSASDEQRTASQYLTVEGAVEGPSGLLRARVDGVHCVGHGEGTWDLIAGEFS